MLIDFEKAKQDLDRKEVEEKIDFYAKKLSFIMDQFEEILEDIETSEINWYKIPVESREKIESISTLGLMLETYAGWSKE